MRILTCSYCHLADALPRKNVCAACDAELTYHCVRCPNRFIEDELEEGMRCGCDGRIVADKKGDRS